MTDVIADARELLKARIAEIDKDAAQLQRTLASLSGDSSGTQRKATRTPKRRRMKKRAKKGQRLKEVAAILKANPKAGTAEIAKQIGISGNHVSALRSRLTKEAPKAQKKQPAKKATPKAARSPKKASAKSEAKKAARKSSRKRKGQRVSKSK